MPIFVTRLSARLARTAGRQSARHSRHSNPQRLASATSAQAEISASPAPSPLAILPLSILLRSLLVAAISSKPFLLAPSLSVLSTLATPCRSWFLNVDRNPVLHAVLKKTFYGQFCAGETGLEAKATIKQLKDMGLQGVIMTYARETVFDHSKTQHARGTSVYSERRLQASHLANIDAWKDGTLKTVDLLSEHDYLAVRLTGAGPIVNEAMTAGELPPPQMMNALEEICRKCKERNVRILVDAESHHFLRGILRVTLELMRRYNRDGYALVYNTYQAYLKSTPFTLAKHLATAQQEGFTLGLKLVRGAYIASDERSLIHDTKENTDIAYNSIAQGVIKQQLGQFGAKDGCAFPSVDLFLASHNRESVFAAHQLHKERTMAGLPTIPVRYAQLHGMSDEVSFSLMQMKDGGCSPKVYKCSIWGAMSECLAYLTRRAIENRDAVLRTESEYTALKTEAARRIKSVFSALP